MCPGINHGRSSVLETENVRREEEEMKLNMTIGPSRPGS